MDNSVTLSAASRDGHLALRRVERQQALIERLHASHGQRFRLEDLSDVFSVSTRTIARDVERLRLSGVPLATHKGRGGGVSLTTTESPQPITFDLPEIAALISSLTVLGPTATLSASSAIRKLTEAIATANTLPRS